MYGPAVLGRAKGNRRSLWLRARMQTFLFKLGNCAQNHSVQVVMIGLVVLVLCTLGLYKARLETNVENLWMEVGGRLEKELTYSKTYGDDYTSYDIIIQTPKTEGQSILTAKALLKHVEVVKKAMEVKVEVFDQTWSVRDLCSKPAMPEFSNVIDKMLEKIIPCTVITPLDCFWDGSKIYSQNITTVISKKAINWTTFDPLEFVKSLPSDITDKMDKSKMDSMLEEAGISHGYLDRPCLDPTEPACPKSAPNKSSKKPPDIGAELTGGCTGFAEKMMIWPEEIIVGGTKRNRSGIMRSAGALQTIISLMGEEELHNWWTMSNGYSGNAKIQHLGMKWNVEAAKTVLNAWQRKFVRVVNEMSEPDNVKQNILAFSTTSFNDLLRDFSSPNLSLIIGGYVLMIAYACFTMMRSNAVQSQGCMGILGVLLVTLSIAAGLGLCSFTGISFNAASTQVLPFVILGVGVDDMFLLSHAYRDLNSKNLRSREYSGYCLSTTGVSMMLTSITNAVAFFLAAIIIAIPALRNLCIMAGVIIVFNFFSIVLIYPAMIGIDVKRRKDQRYDIFCCVRRDSGSNVTRFQTETPSSMTTYNQTSLDEDSTFHQITSSANVSFGQSDAFTLPGVALRASANCNINEPMCNMLGGDIKPGIVVVSVTSSGQNIDGDSSHKANASVNANYGRGRTFDINASSSSSSSSRTNSRRMRGAIPSRINHGCTTSQDNKQSKNAQSSVNIALDPTTVTDKSSSGKSRHNNSKIGAMHVSANATADSFEGESSCSSNAEVILKPENIPSSRQRSVAWQRTINSKLIKGITRLSLGHLTKEYYGPLIQKPFVKVVILFVFAIIFSISVYGCTQVKDGVDMTDVVPKDTKLAEFLTARDDYFSFYDISIITMDDFDYPNKQEELDRLYKALSKIDYIVKDEDGKLPKYWLHYFREWLEGLQKAFDEDWEKGTITSKGPGKNATYEGKLAYKLLLSIVASNGTSQLTNEKLVENGIIHRRGFYSFLRAWYYKDPFGYENSMMKMKPTPKLLENEDERPHGRVRPAERIKYARIPFYINGLKETADYIKLIKQVREICDRFTNEGLPNYPRGVPFTFWEQYIWLREHLLIAVIVVLVASFVIISSILVNIWAGTIVVMFLAMTTVEVFGFLGLAGIKLSAIPAVTLMLSVGIGVEFTVHLCMVFVASVGTRNERVQQALEAVFSPVVHGTVSTILGVIMLAGSEFDFVVKYFFQVLAALIVLGFLNGAILLPVILSLIGPNPEIVPLQNLNSTPCTRSWIGLTPFDRNTCSSVTNLTNDSRGNSGLHQDDTIETEDVQLQTLDKFDSRTRKLKREASDHFDSHFQKTKKEVTPRQMYGKTLPSLTQKPKLAGLNDDKNRSRGMAEVTATATVTVKLPVELKQERTQETCNNKAIIPRYTTSNPDMVEVVDLEDEFV
ncbi:protein patched homolog 1-like isoform X2 [Dendronephthya gigantea]|uniref:protein patched homolog 1-like isoform X2 n=1 Tax=Dendronephthya gigantea TaxID=151771 RepID=UPI00106AA5B1|nr:protein patched homolog 1-like isoform X2 [Dendronephthya gigantea]